MTDLESNPLVEIVAHYYICTLNPEIKWWMNDFIIAEAESELDLNEALDNIKICSYCNKLFSKTKM